MLTEIISGIRAYGSAANMIRTNRLWPFLLITGIISLIIFGLFYLVISNSYMDFGAWITDFYPWKKGRSIVEKSASFFAILTMSLGAFMVFKYILIILVSPFMSPLSERVESKLLDNPTKGSPLVSVNTLKEIWRGLRIAMRNLWRELLLTVFLLLLSLIPGFSIVTAPLIICVQAYYAGFGNMDYTMERYFTISESVIFVRQHRGVAIGNGMVFLLLLAIPIIGVFLAPTLATIAATKEVVSRI